MKKSKKTSEEKLVLAVKPRTIFGRKLGKLRAEGQVPATVYGPDFTSKSVSAGLKDLLAVYKTAKETGIVYIKIDQDEIPVMIKNPQHHPVNNNLLHVDLRKIDLKKKIQTKVPVKTIGVSEAVSQKAGVLLTLSENLLVEALPQDIPQQIEIDISAIKDIGQEIKVSDLPKSVKFEIKDDPAKAIVSVVAHKEESVVAETTVAAPEVITEKAVEGAETTAAETPAASGKPAAQAETKPQPTQKK